MRILAFAFALSLAACATEQDEQTPQPPLPDDGIAYDDLTPRQQALRDWRTNPPARKEDGAFIVPADLSSWRLVKSNQHERDYLDQSSIHTDPESGFVWAVVWTAINPATRTRETRSVVTGATDSYEYDPTFDTQTGANRNWELEWVLTDCSTRFQWMRGAQFLDGDWQGETDESSIALRFSRTTTNLNQDIVSLMCP